MERSEELWDVVFSTFFQSVPKLLDKNNNQHKDVKEVFMKLQHGKNVSMKRNTEKLGAKLITVNCLSCFPFGNAESGVMGSFFAS